MTFPFCKKSIKIITFSRPDTNPYISFSFFGQVCRFGVSCFFSAYLFDGYSVLGPLRTFFGRTTNCLQDPFQIPAKIKYAAQNFVHDGLRKTSLIGTVCSKYSICGTYCQGHRSRKMLSLKRRSYYSFLQRTWWAEETARPSPSSPFWSVSYFLAWRSRSSSHICCFRVGFRLFLQSISIGS